MSTAKESEQWKTRRYTADLLEIPGVAFDVAIDDPKQRIQKYIDMYRDSQSGNVHQGFDSLFMRDYIQVVAAARTKTTASATFEMKAGPIFLNRLGNMHGGAIAMVFDMCTTMTAAPLSQQDFWHFGGVSRTLNITFLHPVQSEQEILIQCEVLQQGARLSTISGKMVHKGTGLLLAVAEHNKASIKFIAPPGKL